MCGDAHFPIFAIITRQVEYLSSPPTLLARKARSVGGKDEGQNEVRNCHSLGTPRKSVPVVAVRPSCSFQ
jgi:hypothetical protein